MFQCSSNAGVNFLQALVTFVPNFTLFCRKSELCHDFAFFGSIFWHSLEICVTFWVFSHYLGLFGILRCFVAN